mgnify:CR=1 FL=1
MNVYEKLRYLFRGLPRFNPLSFAEQREAYRIRMKRISINGVPEGDSLDDVEFRSRVNESFYVNRLENHDNYSGKNRPFTSLDVKNYIFSGATPEDRLYRRLEIINKNNSGQGNLLYKFGGAYGLFFKDFFNYHISSRRERFELFIPKERINTPKDTYKPEIYSYNNLKELEYVYTSEFGE